MSEDKKTKKTKKLTLDQLKNIRGGVSDEWGSSEYGQVEATIAGIKQDGGKRKGGKQDAPDLL